MDKKNDGRKTRHFLFFMGVFDHGEQCLVLIAALRAQVEVFVDERG